MNTPKEILIAARAKIEEGWCRKSYARDRQGNTVYSGNPAASSWCMAGAVAAAANNEELALREPFRLLDEVIGNGGNIEAYNDAPERTKEEVLAIFDKAIQLTGE
jgi:hypothetical protein